MRIQYFGDTDTLYVVFSDRTPSETRDLDENTLFDLDEQGNLVGVTIEHASERVNLASLSYERIAELQGRDQVVATDHVK